jgi:hypothetical protein
MELNRRNAFAIGLGAAAAAVVDKAQAQSFANRFRAAPPPPALQAQLGPLADLIGTWVGHGFSLVALPTNVHDQPPPSLPFLLKLNNTMETLAFTPIGGQIPNRGSGQQPDISFLGLHYLQQISDAVTSGGMHVEPGLWLNLPISQSPNEPPMLARLGTIPHGDALLAQGNLINNGLPLPGGPKIDPIDSTPFTLNAATGARQNDTNPTYLDPYKNPKNLQPGVTPAIVSNPNLVLLDVVKPQTIQSTTVLAVNANPVGGINGTPISPPLIVGNIGNIPFVTTNANANSFSTIFWIEAVEDPSGPPGTTFLQLQYTQTVILEFSGLKWPHIAVATLVKQ